VYATAESALVRAGRLTPRPRSRADNNKRARTTADIFRHIRNPYEIDVLGHTTKSILIWRALKKLHSVSVKNNAK
jgi:hypothetical protein